MSEDIGSFYHALRIVERKTIKYIFGIREEKCYEIIILFSAFLSRRQLIFMGKVWLTLQFVKNCFWVEVVWWWNSLVLWHLIIANTKPVIMVSRVGSKKNFICSFSVHNLHLKSPDWNIIKEVVLIPLKTLKVNWVKRSCATLLNNQILSHESP